MTIQLYQHIMLTRDIPHERLRTGDVAMLVDLLPHPHGGEDGAVLEIFNAVGVSVSVVTVPVSAIESLNPDYIPAVRPFKKAG